MALNTYTATGLPTNGLFAFNFSSPSVHIDQDEGSIPGLTLRELAASSDQAGKGVTTMETKPGIYTTEFWVTMLTNGVGLVNLFGLWDYVPNKWSVLLMAVVNAAYQVSRGQAKSGVAADANNRANYKLYPKAGDGARR
jgi:hypothetical protein